MFCGENEKVKKQIKAICDLSTEHSTFENNQTNSPQRLRWWQTVKQTWLNWYRWVSDLVTGRNFGSLVQQKPHTLFVTTAHRPQQGCVLILITQHTLKHTLHYDCIPPSARLCPHPNYTTLKHTLHYNCVPPSSRLCLHPNYTTYIETHSSLRLCTALIKAVSILITQHTLKHTLHYDCVKPSSRLSSS